MKVTEQNCEDKYGRCYIKFTGVKCLQEIQDWLQQHYQGYKFGMIFDTTSEECDEVGNEYWVYFLDELADEVFGYCDYMPVQEGKYKYYKSRCQIRSD